MDIIAEARVPFSREAVFACYRDKMAELLPFLPNVRKIDVKSREEQGSVVRLVNIWHGGGEIPAPIRAAVGDAILSWTDRAQWNAEDYTCSWAIETHAFTEAVQCKGLNRFYDEGGATRIEMHANITIDARKIKGVPGFLAGGLGRAVEEFFKTKIQPNFVEVTNAIGRHLSESKH